MRNVFAVTAALALLGLSIAAQANVFDLGTGYTNLETVAVGDPGNAADTSYASPGYGSVGYNYNIGKYEVTAKQYTDFLNNKAKSDPHGLYNTVMGDLSRTGVCNIQRTGTSGSYAYSVASDWANRPVNWVSYWDSCRFANWLGNGQGNGDTETGAYTLNGYNGTDGRTIQRNAGATWAVTSEDEWYKAAYYKGGGTTAGYWDYPTKRDTLPSNVGSDCYADPGNHANYYSDGFTYTIGSPYYRTIVGEFEKSGSAYGTFDHGGNVWELNEAIMSGAYRGARGGSFSDSGNRVKASSRGVVGPSIEGYIVGFRVVLVPEPSSIITLAGGLVGLLGIRRRRT